MIYTLTLNPAVDREYRVPAIEFNEILRADAVRNDPGGKGFNVSRMIAGLGGQSAAVGIVGGAAGRWLAGRLASLQIQTEFLEIQTETRVNTTIVTPTGKQYIKVNEGGPELTVGHVEQLLDLIKKLARRGDWWVLAGSLPGGCPRSIYATIIALLQEAGCRVFLDASGEPLRLGCEARPDWIKPNADEAIAITGQPDGLKAGLALRQMGLEQVIVSLGKDGAYFFSDREKLCVAPPPIREQNPIGAGDALVGGVVYQLSLGRPPEEALKWGAACGAAAAALPGTNFGQNEDIEKLVQQCEVTPLDKNER